MAILDYIKTNRMRIALCVGSALLLILSFPGFDLGFLAWFALVPFLIAIHDTTPKEGFKLAYLTGFIFFLGSIYWLHYVSIIGLIILVCCLSFYFGLFGLFAARAMKEERFFIILLPAAWAAIEYLRATLLTGFGWNLLGYSQYKFLSLIQIADTTGAYGVSFLVVMINCAVFSILLQNRRKMLHSSIATFICLAAVLSYGHIRLNEEKRDLNQLRVSVVQGNIPQHRKWDLNFRDEIMDRYEMLSREAAKDNPDLIIWPETSAPGYLPDEEDIFRRIRGLVRDLKVPILLGAPTLDDEGIRFYNSAILMPKEGEAIQQHDKLHRVPFGEYIPFEKYLNWLRDLIPIEIGDFSAGSEFTIFSLQEKPVKFGVLICFEDIFPGLVRRFVKKGSVIIVNITNDAWFMKTSAPYQHAQASVFRAVENRVNVIRSANTGLSCFITPEGEITKRVERRGEPIFIAGFETESIFTPNRHRETPYTRFGDIFAFLSIFVSIGYLSKLLRTFSH